MATFSDAAGKVVIRLVLRTVSAEGCAPKSLSFGYRLAERLRPMEAWDRADGTMGLHGISIEARLRVGESQRLRIE